ncbi:DNA replication factor Cdt1 [Scleropages formosus]|uniref:DNA replication factor Cdt1 n=1 Tax=Scleropages formosus TaxID=113540 RepID=UPI0010FA89D9|nr:DNA replication factor Cdt1 [Scleropages formosus]
MSQARVTDFFSQSKRVNVDGTGSPKAAVQTEVLRVETKREHVRTTRSNSKTLPLADASRTRSTCSTNPVQRDPKTELGEQGAPAVLRDTAGVAANDHGAFEKSFASAPQEAPRTPKRRSPETEFDLSSELFSTAGTGHSSAKKRAVSCRVDPETEPVPRRTEGKTQKRTARKRLVLSNPPEEITVSESKPATEVVSGGKEVKNSVDQSGDSPSAGKLHDSSSVVPQSTAGKKTFSVDDMAALKSRLQKFQEKKGPLPPAAPKGVSSDVKTMLARARELGARAQCRKEEKLAEEAKLATEERKPPVVESENVPAYQRYHTLAQDVPPGLSLPYKFKVLEEMFRSLDTIVGILYNRSEIITFAKVKQGVQDMMHKRFEESHMGQIKTVYPSAFTFQQENNIPTFNATVKKSCYQLTIEPVINKENNDARPLLSSSRLLERRRTFHRNLVDIVKKHHKVFLASLDPPMHVPDGKLTRWHPRFNVDEVPDIQTSKLPQPPQMEKLTTAKEVLDRACSLTPKMERALANMALKTVETTSLRESAQTATPVSAARPKALKGVSESLLERIRAKEAQKLQATMMRNPQQEERLVMMSRLGEMARILRNVFVAEKKPSLIMEVACNRVISSYRSALSTGDMEKHLRLLAELAPDWLTIHPIRKDFYLKLNKTMALNVVLEKLSQKTKEEEAKN